MDTSDSNPSLGICIAAGIENFSEIFDAVVLQSFQKQRHAAVSGKIASVLGNGRLIAWTDGVRIKVSVGVSIVNDNVTANLFV